MKLIKRGVNIEEVEEVLSKGIECECLELERDEMSCIIFGVKIYLYNYDISIHEGITCYVDEDGECEFDSGLYIYFVDGEYFYYESGSSLKVSLYNCLRECGVEVNSVDDLGGLEFDIYSMSEEELKEYEVD